MPTSPISRSTTARSTSSGSGAPSGEVERRLRPAAPAAAPFVDDVAGDPEEPHPERGGVTAVLGAGTLLEARQTGQRREERPFRGVLRLVMIAELVDRVVVHLGHVLPVQRVEPRGVGPSRVHERPIQVEVGETRATGLLRPRHLPQCRSDHLVTPSAGSARRTCRISPTTTERLPPAGSSMMSAPLSGSTPMAR